MNALLQSIGDASGAWSGAWSDAMLRAAIQGGVAVAVVWTACALLPRLSPRVRCWLWRLAAAKFLVALAVATPLDLPLLPAAGSAASSPPADRSPVPSVVAAYDAKRTAETFPTVASAGPRSIAKVEAAGTILPPVPAAPPTSGKITWRDALLLLWAAGVLAAGARVAYGFVTVARWRRAAGPVQRADAAALVNDVTARFRLSRPPAVLESDDVPGPLVTGVLRPAVLVPRDLAASASREELRLLLAHEAAHVRRRDLAWGWFQAAVDVAFFFHPLVWLLRRESRLAQEQACDALALDATGDRPGRLGELLLSLCAAARGPVPGAAALPVAGGPARHLRRRLSALGRPSHAPRRHVAAAALAVALVGTAGLPSWRLVARDAEPETESETDVQAKTDAAAKDDAETKTPADAKADADTNPAARSARDGAEVNRSHALAGQVLDPDGEPVSGAVVTHLDWDPDFTPGKRALADTTTGDDGTFRLPIPAPSKPGDDAAVEVMIEAPGFGLSTGRASRSGTLKVTLNPATELRVAFHDPDGRPVAGLLVGPRDLFERGKADFMSGWMLSLPTNVRERLSRRTDADGFVTLPGMPQKATVHLVFEDDRFARLPYDQRVVLGTDAVSDAPPVRLVAASSVRGRVVNRETGAAVAGVRVYAQPTDRSGGSGHASGTTDASGAYHLRQLSAGEYDLKVELGAELEKEWAAAAVPEFRLAAGQHADAPEFALVRGGLLTGRVLLADSKAGVPDVSVGLHGPARPRSSGSIQGARTDRDGRFSFRVPPGKQYVYLSQRPPEGYLAPGQAGRDVEVKDGETVTADLVLPRDPAPALTGRVLDGAGEPVANAVVTADRAESHHDSVYAKTDADGAFRFVALPAGSILRAKAGTLATTEATTLREDQRRGGVVLVVRPDVTASLLVAVVDPDGRPVPGARIELTVWNGDFGLTPQDPGAVTDATGRYLIESLAPDKQYDVSARAPGFGTAHSKRVKLTPGRRNELEPLWLARADRVIAGRVVDDAGKPLAGVELELDGTRLARDASTTDADGRFAFRVAPGPARRIFLRPPSGTRRPLAEASPGDEAIELVVNPPPAADDARKD